jgi:AcrR family transcriptional regulator
MNILVAAHGPSGYDAAMAQAPPESGSRGSPELWLEAAYHALIEGGIDAVKIQPLAKRLNLSRTSFYWFFKDRQELLAALVARWRDKNTGGIVRQTEAYAESVAEAMLNVFDCWYDPELFDSQFEFAVRSWALQSAEALAEVRAADRIRLDALARMLRRFGHDAASADVAARTVYLVQIGYISMQSDETLADRMARVPGYVAIFTGRKPRRRELDRFFARRGFVPIAATP